MALRPGESRIGDWIINWAIRETGPDGGDYVIREHIPRRRRQRVVEFVRKLNDAVAKMEDRLDRDFVRSDEFADLTEDVLESVAKRAADGKRGFYAAALANTAAPSPPGEDERERMLDALEEVRPSHLRLLAIVATARSLPEGSNLYAGGIEHNIMPRLRACPRSRCALTGPTLLGSESSTVTPQARCLARGLRT